MAETKRSTIIIGNGFDKNCGLKTGYTDAYKEYVKSPSVNKWITDFKKNIGDNYENWSDFELGMAEYARRLSNEDEFIACVNDFNAFLNSYLTKVQKAFVEELNQMKMHNNVKKNSEML